MPNTKPPSKSQVKKLSKLLGEGEKVILVTTIGPRYFWIMLIFMFFIPLIFTYIPFLIFLGFFDFESMPWFKFLGIPGLIALIYFSPKFSHLLRMKQSYTYALSNRRFLIIRGIFSRKIVTAPLTAITHVTIEQSMLQRFLFNTGHLVIITAGFDQREIVIENIGNPVEFKIMVEDLTRKIEDSWEGDKEEKEDFKLRSLAT